jgi:hypothetical protein
MTQKKMKGRERTGYYKKKRGKKKICTPSSSLAAAASSTSPLTWGKNEGFDQD